MQQTVGVAGVGVAGVAAAGSISLASLRIRGYSRPHLSPEAQRTQQVGMSLPSSCSTRFTGGRCHSCVICMLSSVTHFCSGRSGLCG